MATYYLNADTGVDSGAGGSGAPWLTLAYAYSHSTGGDTLYFQNSTATYTFSNQTLANRTITGQSATGVVLDGGGAVVGWALQGTVTINNITVQNITKFGNQWRAVLSVSGSEVILTVNGCIFHNIETFRSDYGDGVIGSSYAQGRFNVTINGCLFYDIKLNSSGVAGAVFGFRVMNNTVASSFSVTNCTVCVTAVAPNKLLGMFNFFDAGGNTTLPTVTVKNTILSNQSGLTLKYEGNTIWYTLSVTYSDLYLLTSAPTGTGVITSDPLFVDPTNSNFRLRPTSPCIDTGTLV